MIRAGILGATGAVGQRFVEALIGHPWFEITSLAASERSAGKPYGEAAQWRLNSDIPGEVAGKEVVLVDPDEVEADIVFSALPSGLAGEFEPLFADSGFAVASNASALRMWPDVPLMIPELNPDHLSLIDVQQENRGWDGYVVTNPNCSTIVLALSLAPLTQFGIESVRVATMQAVSGAGYEGVPSMAILDNLIPYIGGEEEKMETEAQKILGTIEDGRVKQAPFWVSASCHRVPVFDGHTMAVWIKMRDDPSPDEVKRAFKEYTVDLGDLPTSPERPIIYRDEVDRPQPRMDRDQGDGMSVSVGRVREARDGEIRYICLGHNTIRGAAGASVLNAELLHKQGRL